MPPPISKSRTAAPRIDFARLFGKRGFGAEVKRGREAEQSSRDQGARAILGTDTIRDKDVDAASLLFTTLGGKPRRITLDDLRQFEHLATKLGKQFKGGITARGVIDHSLQVDRDRANREIRTAVVMSAKAGLLHFVTNAGPDSDVHRHHVHVSFPAFSGYAASAADPKRLARQMLNGPLQFECDCGRFRFWYRFIATKGKFVHGRLETGYPKIRNPNLVGVSCKHGLRVMQAVLNDANALAQAAKMIASAQAGAVKADHKLTAAEAKAQAEAQAAKAHHQRQQVETSTQRVDRISKTPQARARAILKAAEEAKRRAEEHRRKTGDTAEKMLRDARRRLENKFPPHVVEAMLKAAADALKD